MSSHEISPERLKIKFYSNTWLVTGEDSVRTQLLVIGLLECLEKHGFRVFTAVETPKCPFKLRDGWLDMLQAMRLRHT